MAEDIAIIAQELDDNADWFVAQSTVKCGNYITAVTKLLHRSEEAAEGGRGVNARFRFNYEELRKELERARKWFQTQNTASSSGASGSFQGVDFTVFDQR